MDDDEFAITDRLRKPAGPIADDRETEAIILDETDIEAKDKLTEWGDVGTDNDGQ